MSKRKSLDINEIVKQKWLVEFNRKPLDKDSLFGFVLACNDEFTLVQKFDDGLFVLDGYCVFRNDEIKRFKVYDEDSFLNEVIKLKKLKPKHIPQVSIESWADILQTSTQLFPLLVVERERIDNKICYIGKLEQLKKKSFSLQAIDTDACWIGSFRYKFKDLTKVSFGGHYENTLALVVENREKLKS